MLEQSRLRPDAGIVGCKLLNTDRSVQLQSIQKFPTILTSVLDAEYLLLRWPHCPLWDIQPLFQENVKVIKVKSSLAHVCCLSARCSKKSGC